MSRDLSTIAVDLIARARTAGATSADAVAFESDSIEVGVRLRETEKLRRARERAVGLRVFVGQSTAIVSTSDLSSSALEVLAQDAVSLARATAPDEHGGLPDPADLARDLPDLALYDAAVERFDVPDALALAREAEEAALSASTEITNSEGAECGAGGGQVAYASSLGFTGTYARSSFSLVMVPVATRDGQMQRDHWYSAHRTLAGLDAPGDVGREAARRTVRRLGARQVPTQQCPVVFDPQAAASLIGHLAGAISGSSLYRRASFLLDKLGEPIASPAVTILDDPLAVGGLASRPFDGEGVASRRLTIVEKGVLQSYLLDSYSARRLGMRSTGHAARGASDAPGVSATNFFLTPGPHTPEEIVRSVRSGLYVTELIGFGVNGVTGDYSRGAAGLWIENGELTFAVEEITIAGNLLDMFKQISMVGTDLRFRTAVAAPTIKIEQMMLAGA